jgi:ligand-binding sensor domain-containing protein
MRAASGHYPANRVWQVLVQTTLMFFCLTRLLSAQTISEGGDGYIIDVWQTDDGLPENEVTSIAQTSEGYLWIGLFHGGLARFDGIRFTVFNPFNTPELRANEIQSLGVDARGVLWIGPSDASLTTWNRGRFHLERPEQSSARLRLDSVVGVHSDQVVLTSALSPTISLMVGAASSNSMSWTYSQPTASTQPFYCMDRDGVIWYRTIENWLGWFQAGQAATLPRHLGVPGHVISVICTDGQSNIWVGSDGGVARWAGGRFENCNPTNEVDFNVQGMNFTGDGGLWVLENNGRLRKYLGNQWVVATPPGTLEFKLATRRFQLHGDRDGGLWVVSYDEAVWHVRPDGKVQKLTQQNGLPSTKIECWFQDKEGNIWMGTSSSGLVRLRKRMFHVVQDSAVLPDRIVRSVCEDRTGAVWMGTSSGLVTHWQGDVMTTLDLSAVAPPPIFDITVCSDAAGRLWIGTVQSGVLVRENGILRRPFPSQDVHTVARVLFADRQGRMWFGSEFGLECWQNGILRKFGAGEVGSPCHVTGIAEDSKGVIWISTATSHLLRFADGIFQTFKSPGSFSKAHFWCLTCDPHDLLWIGTLGGGLVRFHDGQFARISSEQGLPNDYVSQVLCDGRGNLWAGSRGGIFSMDLRTLNEVADEKPPAIRSEVYGRAEGLPTVECSSGFQPGCWRGQDDRLWFSTVKGVVWVQPKELDVNSLPPSVLIEEVQVDGSHNWDLGGDNQPAGNAHAGEHNHSAQFLRLGPGRHYVEFQFAGLNLSAPDKVRFKWKMEGLDLNWIYGGGRRVVGYGSMPPGTYTFHVTACNSDGVWNETGAAIGLIIQPFFWQTWWFKIMLLLLAGGLVWTIFAVRISRIRALQSERLRIARDLHDEVGAGLGTIALLGEFIEQHPTTSDGQEVRQMALQTIDALRDIVWFIDPTFNQMSDLVIRLQTTAKARLLGLEVNFQQTGDFENTELMLSFRRNVLPLFKEALHNIIKHAHATRVDIRVGCEGNKFQLSISDNGSGFDPGKSMDGNGLKNMRRRARDMKGDLQVLSSPASGATVCLTAPLP